MGIFLFHSHIFYVWVEYSFVAPKLQDLLRIPGILGITGQTDSDSDQPGKLGRTDKVKPTEEGASGEYWPLASSLWR
jgi:hypothetical protein